jgi:hypothetical protein
MLVFYFAAVDRVMSLCKLSTQTRWGEFCRTRSLNCEDRTPKDLRDWLEDALVGWCTSRCYDSLGRVGHAKPLSMTSHRQHLTLDDGTDLHARNNVVICLSLLSKADKTVKHTSDGASNSCTSRSVKWSGEASLKFSTMYRWKPTAQNKQICVSL